MALKADPELTAVEAAAIAKVGQDQIELNIAPNEGCAESMTAYAILILIALAIMPVENPGEHLDEPSSTSLDREVGASVDGTPATSIRLQRGDGFHVVFSSGKRLGGHGGPAGGGEVGGSFGGNYRLAGAHRPSRKASLKKWDNANPSVVSFLPSKEQTEPSRV
ncbi:hypothetical protein [Pseudarthrobacter sp. IC2-21]|uniref:hypothetical protein n=1 Tax=Pseudarthrobacter sp. IC2-21 TaxID=3092262 RepID=UPI002A6AD471|nr:hypothetical protein [Pseudarthrobacter sp. IC2-21]